MKIRSGLNAIFATSLSLVTWFGSSIRVPAFAQSAVLNAANRDSIINVRLGPATFYDPIHQGVVGDRVEILERQSGQDGYPWYRVRFQRSAAEGWVRGDLIRVLGPASVPRDRLPTNPPGDRNVIPPNTGVQPPPRNTGVQPPVRSPFTAEQIDYFYEIALGNEFGRREARIRKWQQPVRIKVHGSPSRTDLATLQAIVSELRQLTRLNMSISDRNPNIDIYFVPEADFYRYEPNYRPRNLGFFWTWWDNYSIERARILISTTGVTPTERAHLLREELTQSMGLMIDSTRYPDSIFYQPWTTTTQYSDLDRAIIRLLYIPEIVAGMGRLDTQAALSNLGRSANLPQ